MEVRRGIYHQQDLNDLLVFLIQVRTCLFPTDWMYSSYSCSFVWAMPSTSAATASVNRLCCKAVNQITQQFRDHLATTIAYLYHLQGTAVVLIHTKKVQLKQLNFFVMRGLLDAQYLQRIPLVIFNIFLLLNSFAQGYVINLAILHTDHNISLVFQQGLNRCNTHAGS